MKDSSLALVVAQAVDHEPWDAAPVIPKDDSAVFTTLLPLVAIVLLFLLALISSMSSPGTLD